MAVRAGGESVTTTAEPSAAWPPARLFLVAGGIWLLVLGTIGFFLDGSFPTGAAEAEASHSAHIFGVFETNGWHNLAAVALAAVALPVAFGKPSWSRAAAMLIGVVHVGVTLSLVLWEPSTFWLASNDADQVVHATYAAGGVASAFATTPS